MIVALLNQTGGFGNTTTALRLSGKWAHLGLRVIVIDADSQSQIENCWLDLSKQRAKEGLPRSFVVIGLARDTLHRGSPEIVLTVDHVVIARPSRVAALVRTALLVADVVLIPVQPSSFGEWAPNEMLKLLEVAHIFHPELLTRFRLNRCGSRILIDRERIEALAEHDRQLLRSRIDPRLAFVAPAPTGEITRIARGRPAITNPPTARLTIDITPELRGRIKITAFRRGLMVIESCAIRARIS
jgi:chromosome partitioning protein